MPWSKCAIQFSTTAPMLLFRCHSASDEECRAVSDIPKSHRHQQKKQTQRHDEKSISLIFQFFSVGRRQNTNMFQSPAHPHSPQTKQSQASPKSQDPNNTSSEPTEQMTVWKTSASCTDVISNSSFLAFPSSGHVVILTLTLGAVPLSLVPTCSGGLLHAAWQIAWCVSGFPYRICGFRSGCRD